MMVRYESDFYGWTQQQAALLKAGQLADLDIKNLIEEVETMGRSEKQALESRLTVLLHHLLKWHYQAERRGRSWQLTIKEQRTRFTKLLRDNPSLKSQLNETLIDAYEFAVLKAAKETTLEIATFPAQCPWPLAQILDPDFYPY